MFGFIVGVIAGGLAAYYWRDRIRPHVDRTPELRERAAERLGELRERASTALNRARDEIERGVRAGQEKLRSPGSAGPSGPSTP
jgi:dsDNA-specific endonuclease/ATPase MutS2